MILQPPIPVLRIFDARLAKQFYLEWLGFDPFGNRLAFNQPLGRP